MSDAEPLTCVPSREGPTQQQAQADLQAACCGLPSNSPPSVNSAFCHVQEMKRLVGNWCHQHHFEKYQPEIDQEKHYIKSFRFQSKDHDSDSGMSTDLYVEGVAVTDDARDSCQSFPLQKNVDDVLMEVMHLIEHLEADRKYAEEALQREREKRKILESKLDSMSLWKQTEHLVIIQKEQEACRRNVTELKLKLKREKKKSDQLQMKVSHAEALNCHLKEDISFVRKQLPIVRENLDIQKDLVNQIQIAQAEADEVCSATKSQLLQAQTKLKEMEHDAKMISLDPELIKIKNHLAKKLKDLKKLKILESKLLAETNNVEETITLTENKCTGITQRISELVNLEKIEKDKISCLNLQIEDEMQKNGEITEKLILIKKQKATWEGEVSCTKAQLKAKCEALAAVRESYLECKKKLEDCKRKISESKKAVKQMREERKQMLQKISDNDEQWEKASEEATQVVSLHSVTQAKLEEQEQLTLKEKQRARTEIDNLSKELTAVMTALNVMKARSTSVQEELKKQQNSSLLINQQLQKEFEEQYSATKALESKLKKMKELTDNLEKTQNEYNVTLFNLKEEEKLKHDQLEAARELHSSTLNRYDSTMYRIAYLKKQLDGSDQLEKNIEDIQDTVNKLQKRLNVLEFKHESAALIMNTLKSDIDNCQQQTEQFMQTCTPHLEASKKKMEDTKEALEDALTKNKQLTSDYKRLQKTLLEARKETVTALTKKNCTHETYHYYKKLSLFQKRMHKALVKYLEQRNLYSLAELDQCQALAQETTQKIKTAQDELSEVVQLVSVFLESLGYGSTTTDDTGKNEQALPDASGLKE